MRHARDMVARKYFAHNAPSGQNFVQRIFDILNDPKSPLSFTKNDVIASLHRDVIFTSPISSSLSPAIDANVPFGGAGLMLLLSRLYGNVWIVLPTALSSVAYVLVLKRIDGIALHQRENIISQLGL